MAKKNTPLVSALKKVKRLLTKKNWNKGSYFSDKNGQFCMCVHGAAQSIVNPQVKKIIDEFKTLKVDTAPLPPALSPAAAAERAVLGEEAEEAARATWQAASCGSASASNGARRFRARTIWNSRPDWIKNNLQHQGLDYGNLDIHYLMGMCGLTTLYNDSPDTTLTMIKNKLNEAITLAQTLQV